jgi:hypothetical protein
MRRSHLIVIALLAGAAAGTVAYVRADAYSCQQAGTDSCRGKKDCCAPPPCMYRNQLTMYRMLQSLFADKQIVACGKGDVEAYVASLAKKAPFQTWLPSCPDTYAGRKLDPPPGFHTARKNGDNSPCGIFLEAPSGSMPTSLESAKTWSTTSTELLGVNIAHENVHMDTCAKAGTGTPVPPADQAAVAADEVKAYQTSIDEMEKLFANWQPRCTAKNSRKKAEAAAKKGIEALKAAMKSKSGKAVCP